MPGIAEMLAESFPQPDNQPAVDEEKIAAQLQSLFQSLCAVLGDERKAKDLWNKAATLKRGRKKGSKRRDPKPIIASPFL